MASSLFCCASSCTTGTLMYIPSPLSNEISFPIKKKKVSMISHDHNVLNNQTTKLSFRDSQVPAPVVSQQDDTHLEAPTTDNSETIVRRSGNYPPTIWDDDFVQSLRSDYTGEIYTKRAEELKEDIRRMFHAVTSSGSSSSLLKLIDTIQRLGVSYHFADEIKGALDTIVSNMDKDVVEVDEDLFSTALRFRLLRQHWYVDEVSQEKLLDIFKSFKAEMGSSGDWKPCILEDVEGMLSLYEASFYAFEGEEILDEAQIFTTRLLKEYLSSEGINNTSSSSTPDLSNVKQLISHALELPLHWRSPRIEARWFIDAYENMQDQLDYQPLLLEFAKLDFNIVQATYQEELKYVSRWWKELGLSEALSYARDRLVECFFWSMGYNFDPRLEDFRIEMTKLNILLTAVDDTYDIYGSLEELELFTDAVERWDSTMEGLPEYMRVLFLAVYNSVNELAYEILKKHDWDVLPYLKKAYADICNAYLVEAKWYYSGYTPTFEEHINISWISAAGSILPCFAYCLLGTEIREEPLECLQNYSSNLVRCTFTAARLLDDLGNSTDELKRGDAPSSIQCYMNQEGVSESIAREHNKHLIRNMWKKINKDQSTQSIFPRSFVDTMLYMIRVAHCFYWYGGDGFNFQDRQTKDWIMSIVIEPIPIEDKTETETY